MIGKAMALSLMLLANRSGAVSEHMVSAQNPEILYQESERVLPAQGEVQGDGMSSQLPQAVPPIVGTQPQKDPNQYPRISYTQDKDGSWVCKGRSYKYRFELIGRNAGSGEDGRFLVLTNNENLSFSMVSKSFTGSEEDRLSEKDTIVVEAGWY